MKFIKLATAALLYIVFISALILPIYYCGAHKTLFAIIPIYGFLAAITVDRIVYEPRKKKEETND